MSPASIDPEIAKQLARGPAGEILSKFPAHYAKAIFFGDAPLKGQPFEISSGTVTLIALPKRKVAVTCWHVLDKYREYLCLYKRVIAQIGDTVIDPLRQLVDESPGLDLAVIDLTDRQAKEITSQGEIGSRFVDGRDWPPRAVKSGDVVMLSGFAGAFRQVISFNEVVFVPFCAAGIKVHHGQSDYFTCQFEREFWVKSFGANDDNKHLETMLGGMSGGPAFVDRGLNWEFGGFIYQHSPEFDIVRLRPATLIGADGALIVP